MNGCPECGSAGPNIRHLLDADAHPCDNPWHDPPKGRAGASWPAPSSEKAEAERDEWRAAHARALRDREAVEAEMDRRLGEAWAERDAAHREVADLLAVVGGVRALRERYFDEHGDIAGEDGWRFHRDLLAVLAAKVRKAAESAGVLDAAMVDDPNAAPVLRLQ